MFVQCFRRVVRVSKRFGGAILFCIALPIPALAAVETALYLDPETGVYPKGGTFTVTVRLDTGGEAVNASEGELSFDAEKLSVETVSTQGSLLSSWTQEPSFDNTEGVISFGGITTDPFSGEGGDVLTITFRAESVGETSVVFTSGAAISATDGLGSNIVSELRAGTYTLTPTQTVPRAENTETVATAPRGEIVISSPTHPDQAAWYRDRSVTFVWSLPEGTSAVRTLLDNAPESIPTDYRNEPVTEASFNNLADGVWYFHVQARRKGVWGPVAHYRIGIDTARPEIRELKEVARRDLSDPHVSFRIRAVDELSGIDHYEIKIDEEGWERWVPASPADTYAPDGLVAGKHTLIVRAYDRAGNYATDSRGFSIHFAAAPAVTGFTKPVLAGKRLTLSGITLPNAEVTVRWKHSSGTEGRGTVRSNAEGRFSFRMAEPSKAGAYTFHISAQDESGRTTKTSDAVHVAVAEQPLASIGHRAVGYLSVVVPLVTMVIFLTLLIAYGIRRVRTYEGVVAKEVGEAEHALRAAFDALRNELAEYRAMLDKAATRRDLTYEEQRLYRFLSRNFSDTEHAVRKEIHDIAEAERPVPPRKKLSVKAVE